MRLATGFCRPRPPKKQRPKPSSIALGAPECRLHAAGLCPTNCRGARPCARRHIGKINCGFGPASQTLLQRDPTARCANGSGCCYIHDGTGTAPEPLPTDPLAKRIAAAKAAKAPGSPPRAKKHKKTSTPSGSKDMDDEL